MNPVEKTDNGVLILTDGDLDVSPQAWWFDPLVLAQQGVLLGQAEGRGSAWFMLLDGRALVLRHYFRGGLVGRLTRDLFVWNGQSRTRAWLEWHLLAQMHAQGLPVPSPFAAAIRKRGWRYTCDIITETIPETSTLADRLALGAETGDTWQRIGAVIRRFHVSGIYHSDLNARNILLNQHDAVFVIDFDKAKRLPPLARWQQANLARLLRSLRKFKTNLPRFAFDETRDWPRLLEGYKGH